MRFYMYLLLSVMLRLKINLKLEFNNNFKLKNEAGYSKISLMAPTSAQNFTSGVSLDFC